MAKKPNPVSKPAMAKPPPMAPMAPKGKPAPTRTKPVKLRKDTDQDGY